MEISCLLFQQQYVDAAREPRMEAIGTGLLFPMTISVPKCQHYYAIIPFKHTIHQLLLSTASPRMMWELLQKLYMINTNPQGKPLLWQQLYQSS